MLPQVYKNYNTTAHRPSRCRPTLPPNHHIRFKYPKIYLINSGISTKKLSFESAHLHPIWVQHEPKRSEPAARPSAIHILSLRQESMNDIPRLLCRDSRFPTTFCIYLAVPSITCSAPTSITVISPSNDRSALCIHELQPSCWDPTFPSPASLLREQWYHVSCFSDDRSSLRL
jgi:hypothetical protein